MAARKLYEPHATCNSCRAYDRVSLTFERCALHGRAILAQDPACNDQLPPAPWLAWGLSVSSGSDR